MTNCGTKLLATCFWRRLVLPLLVAGSWLTLNPLPSVAASSSYSSAVLGAGPVAYWRLSEPAGPTVFDNSGHGNNGSTNGGISFGVAGAISDGGDSDPAMSFNGSNTYIQTSLDVSQAALPSTTWEAWVYPTNVSNGQTIMGSRNTTDDRSLDISNGYFEVGNASSGKWRAVVADQNQWQHIALVYTPNSITFYKNGLPISCSCGLGPFTNSNPLTIGRDPLWGTSYFSGRLDEVAVYATALELTAIQTHFENGTGHAVATPPPSQYSSAVSADTPVAYWRMDETSGGIAVDASGHNNAGAWYGSVVSDPSGALVSDSDASMSFNGSSAYIQTSLAVSQSALPTTTWEAWVYPTNVSNGQTILGSKNTTDDRSLGISGGYFEVGNAGIGTWRPATADLNQWQHIALVYTPSGITFYKNGSAYNCSCGLGPFTNANPLTIGRDPLWGTNYFSGKLDEIAIYASALSNTEISRHFSLGSQPSTYSCANSHCYAQIQWPAVVSGAHTTIDVTHVASTKPSSLPADQETLSNELWVNDVGLLNPSSICAPQGGCWVEAGYAADSGSVYYFWADNRPASQLPPNTPTYKLWRQADVPTADYGGSTDVTITRVDSSTYQIFITSLSFPDGMPSGPMYSTSNPMTINRTDIGMELSGTSGASAPKTAWGNNQYIQTDGTAVYQTTGPDAITDDPPFGWWYIKPGGAILGGKFLANCC
jgi:Concanavalin A-like lectin/glucanases superfamily